MNFIESQEYNRQFLDSLPIDEYLEYGIDLRELMDELKERYESLTENDPVLEGCLFNYLAVDEFADYLRNRYKGIRVIEEYIPTYKVVM